MTQSLQYNQDDVDKSNAKTPSFMLTGNRFDSNNNFVVHARMESSVITRIHNNNFVGNNERSKSGTAIVEIAPDEVNLYYCIDNNSAI